ncbi:MAG: Rieske 2Fe-2S domain-containing protein [Planctomycetes bacterium]|nr:Rieske 2Fe-2S domain-containing protein [Planctomycetota bacterium]
MTKRLEVHPDIRQARRLDGAFYHEPELYSRALERIFARSWQWLGPTGEAPGPGEALPFTFLEGSLDEPLLLTWAEGGKMKLLSNACTHRGMLLCTGSHSQRHLRCPYHGRRFLLDGAFVSTPGFEGAEGFPSAEEDLPQLALEELDGHLFGAVDPAVGFKETAGSFRSISSFAPLGKMRENHRAAKVCELKANWALFVEDHLEGFHVPVVHSEPGGPANHAANRTELFPWSVLYVRIAAGADPVFWLPENHPDSGKRVAAFHWWIWPNLMLDLYPWGLSLIRVDPLGPARCRVTSRSFSDRPESTGAGAGSDLRGEELEDEEFVETVQRGVRSRLRRSGRYSPAHEAGVHAFHRMIAAAMAGSAE